MFGPRVKGKHFLLQLCLAVTILAAISLPRVAAQSTNEAVQAVAGALGRQEFGKALELLQPALQRHPDDARLWAMQGAAYAGENKRSAALRSYRRALKISPDYLVALRGAAQLEYAADSMAAIPLIEHILRLQPDDQIGHGMLAVLEYEKGDCGAAVAQFEKSGDLFASRAEGLNAYGVCLVRLKQLAQAATVFQKIVELEPDNPKRRLVLAAVQMMAHQPQAALGTLEPVLKGGHADAATLDLASSAYEQAKDTGRAVALLKQAILLDPQNVNLYLDFTHICYDHDAYQVGIGVLNDGIKLNPRAAPLFLARGVLYVELSQYENAEADFAEAYRLDPLQSLSSAGQALVGEQTSHFQAALAKVQAGLKQNPKDPLLLYLEADFLMRQGAAPGSPQFQKALMAASKSVRLRPSLVDAHNVLATIYMESGRYRDAVEQCRESLRINPQDRTALYHLIQGLRKTGQTKELPALLKKFAELRELQAREDDERYQYKLVEGNAEPASQSRH